MAVIANDHILFYTGIGFSPHLLDDSCRPDLVVCDLLPARNNAWEVVDAPEMYIAGT